MKKSLLTFLMSVTLLFFVVTVQAQNKNVKVLSDIEEYIKGGRNAPSEMGKSIIEQLEKDSNGVAAVLIEKTKAASVNEEALSVYIWAIGFTKDANATDELIRISKNSASMMVKGNAIQSLAKIGSERAGAYLLSQAKIAPDADNSGMEPEGPGKFDLLNCLAEMQYEPALPEMEVILEKDYEKYYWQQIFCFGKMGDKAVPFLLKRIDNSDRNVRYASIMLLGQILTTEEAAKPLIAQYRKEKDPSVRKNILNSLERIMPDLNEMENFFKEALAKEEDKEVKTFAEETIANLSSYRQQINEAKAKKKNDRDLFDKTYKSLYKGYGHDGSYETLAACSRLSDEPKLKKLRERVLFRNSDECFYDCQKINEIIMFNRFIADTK